MTNPLYKEFFEVFSDKEGREKWLELRKKGYKPQDIYEANYKGKDGCFHRQIFVFADK